MTVLPSPLWMRLDTPGHDACLVEPLDGGWRLRGTAVFAHDDGPASLTYSVDCDAGWVSRLGRVRGWIGERAVQAEVRHTAGRWSLDGVEIPEVEDCLDLDFGFTPATNYLQLRRLDIPVGETREFDVAWFDGEGDLIRLPQTYERLTETTYDYASPQGGYRAVLEMGPGGFVVHYPTLWRAR